jgi:hypothetical protein
MEKQHNRGQDGAGVACIKLDVLSRGESTSAATVPSKKMRLLIFLV